MGEEKGWAEGEGEHADCEDHVGGHEVHCPGDDVRGEDADEAVGEEVEGCYQGRGVLVALPELDGVELPAAACGYVGRE